MENTNQSISQEDLVKQIFEARAKGESIDDVMKQPLATDVAPPPAREPETTTADLTQEESQQQAETTPPAGTEQANSDPNTTATPESNSQATTSEADLGWLEKVPEDVRDKVQALIQERDFAAHQFKSNSGRISGLQRKQIELQNELAKLKPLAVQRLDMRNSKVLKQLAQNDPELAEGLNELINEAVFQQGQHLAKQADEKINTVSNALMSATEQEYLQEQWSVVTQHVENAAEILQDEYFQKWWERQTPGVRNLVNSTEADDMLLLMGIYDQHCAQFRQAPQQAAPARQHAATAAPTQPQVTPEAQAIDAARNRRATAVTPGASRGPMPSQAQANEPKSHEDLVKYFYEQRQKQRQR